MIDGARRLLSLRPRHARLAVTLVVLVAAYLFLAPAACGGPITYARVAGSSMTPRLQSGDLVFARAADTYEAGDVVAYHNPELGLVMHRVIVDNGDRVIVKGDANSWVDSYQPRKSDIVGRLWLRIPHGAVLLGWLQPPWATLAFTLLGLAVFAYPLLRHRSPRTQRPRWDTSRARVLWRTRLAPALTVYAPAGSVLALATIVVVGVSLLLATLAFARPPQRVTSEERPYTQQAHFRYDAEAPPGLYDDPTIHEGDPVFLRLTRAVRMGVDVAFEGERLERPEGTVRLIATLQQVNGWERTMVLAPERHFTGTQVAVDGTLDLSAFRRMVEEAEAASGVHFESYQLVVRADIRAQVGDHIALRPFEPHVVFRISSTQLQLERAPSGERSPLTHASSGVLRTDRVEPNLLALGPWSPGVATVRFWSPLALLASLVLLAALARATATALRGTEAERIEVQYGSLILRARLLDPPPHVTLVRMQSFEDLARMARVSGLPILRRSDNAPDYLLLTPEAAYHYEAAEHERPSAITARIAQRIRPQAA